MNDPHVTPMTWTTNKPTVPGWYWWRTKYLTGEEVEYIERVLYVEHLDGELGVRHYNTIARLGGEWAGPFEMPK